MAGQIIYTDTTVLGGEFSWFAGLIVVAGIYFFIKFHKKLVGVWKEAFE